MSMFQICFTGISVLGYFSHGDYCPSLCFPERRYIGVTANPETLSSELILFMYETRTVLCRYLPVRLCINPQFIFPGLCHVCIHCGVCSAAGVDFSGEMLEAVTARPSRWYEGLQLHCCLCSHHCGANQCQGRGQLSA